MKSLSTAYFYKIDGRFKADEDVKLTEDVKPTKTSETKSH